MGTCMSRKSQAESNSKWTVVDTSALENPLASLKTSLELSFGKGYYVIVGNTLFVGPVTVHMNGRKNGVTVSGTFFIENVQEDSIVMYEMSGEAVRLWRPSTVEEHIVLSAWQEQLQKRQKQAVESERARKAEDEQVRRFMVAQLQLQQYLINKTAARDGNVSVVYTNAT